MKWRSAITTTYQKKMLFKGTLIAAIGALIIFVAAIFLNEPLLDHYGFWIYAISLILITIGLLPLRKMQKLIQTPFELSMIGEEQFLLERNGAKLASIPLSSIKNIHFCENKRAYGIAIDLKEKPLEKVRILEGFLPYLNPQKRLAKVFKTDLFLPYFTRRSFDELKNELQNLS